MNSGRVGARPSSAFESPQRLVQFSRLRITPQAALLRIVDLGMLATLFVAPLVMGGRHPAGKWVLTALVTCTAFSWFIHQFITKEAKWELSGAELVFISALALVSFQLVPLPERLLSILTPASAELLPSWQRDAGDGSLGTWRTVSLSPEQTRQGLVLLATYVVLFSVAFQRMRTIDDVERLFKWVASAAVSMAGLGLLQYLVGNGKYLWLYEHPFRNTLYTVKGTFANQNHFAHFLALGLIPLIWGLEQILSRRPSQRGFDAPNHLSNPKTMALSFGIGLTTLAAVLSFSRGGLAIVALVLVSYVGLRAFQGRFDKKVVLWAAAVTAGLFAALTIHGHERLADRIATVTDGSVGSLDPDGARRTIWSAVAEATPDFAILGSGVGSHREIYPRYMATWSDFTYSHAENGYLQIALETGIPGLLLTLVSITLAGWWIFVGLRGTTCVRIRTCSAVVAVAWIATLAHSVIDFVWYIPACFSCLVLLMAAAARLHCLAQDRNHYFAFTKFNWLAVAVAILGFGGLANSIQMKPALASTAWDRYLTMSLSIEDEKARLRDRGELSQGPLAHTTIDQLNQMAHHLEEAIAQNPNDSRSHLRLATTYLHLFELHQQHSENPMSLWSIREAATSSDFPSTAELRRWLKAATGTHHGYLDQAWNHALQAVHLCPLHGKAYLHLSELAFIKGFDNARKSLVQQAMNVRPYDGAVLYTAGYEAIQEQDVETATLCFQKAFHHGPDIRGVIVQTLAPQIPPVAFIEVFRPDANGLKLMYQYYQAVQDKESAQFIGRKYVEALAPKAEEASGADAARLWYETQAVYGFLGDYQKALTASQNALAAQPGDYRLTYLLGVRFDHAGDFERSLTYLRQCERRRPHDATVSRKIAEVESKLRQ